MKSISRSSKRKAKRSQKPSKKKIRSTREKPKKLKQPRDDSVSCSDEGSISVSCSSSGEDRRDSWSDKNRGRSRDRRRRRDKKRSKRSSLVSESSVEDSLPRVKKSKKSKKSKGSVRSESRKKRHVKRRRRDRSVSSSSGRSRSCSVGEPCGDSERKFQRKEEKVLKERKGREKDRERIGRKRFRPRSRSCSACSMHSESSDHFSEERMLEESYPKRLKSVIVVVKELEVPQERESNRDDGHEDEIVCEYDEYPSKSNDSVDGISGREAVPCLHDVSSKKRFLDEPNKASFASDVRTPDIPGIQRQVVEGSGGSSPSSARSRINVPLMENMSAGFTADAGSNREDLEAALRQKALENLLKRQGKLSTKVNANKKGVHDIKVDRSSIVKAQLDDQPTTHDEGNIKTVLKVGKVVNDVRYTTNLHGPFEDTALAKDNDAHLLSMKVKTAHPEEKGKAPGDFVNNRPNVDLSMSRPEILGAKNIWRRKLIPQESFQKSLSVSKEMNDSNEKLTSQDIFLPKVFAPQDTISKEYAKDSASFQFDSNGNIVEVDAVALSEASASVSEEQSMNDKTNNADQDTQFQQKTMSVMRGGELVQVNYKVYIPKKAPALARRQLKR